MSWETFLTVWIALQFIGKVYEQVNQCIDKGKTRHHMLGAIVGSVGWLSGMYWCLYAGGFYS